jgi:hypothetical protein
MDPRALKSNEELATYLARISTELSSKGAQALADDVGRARRFVSGSPSEFLHEAELALANVRDNHNGALDSSAAAEVHSVIAQIQAAFSKVGGA